MSTAVAAPQVAWWREPTRAQWTTFLAAWAGWVLDAFDFTIYLLAMADIMKAFGVDAVATSISVWLTLTLRLVGGIGAGWLADRFGRKLPLVISLVWFAVCDGAVAFAPSFWWVIVFRALFGLGMGAQWTAGATLAMENWPQRSKGTASGILQGSWAIGYILAALVYWAVEPTHGWRALFIVAAIPALLALPIWYFVPESEEWRRLAAERRAAPPAPHRPLLERIGTAYRSLQAEQVVLRIAWASVLWATSFAVYYGLSGMWPTLLRTLYGLGAKEIAWLVITFNLGMMAGAITWGTVASKKGAIFALSVPLVLLVPFLPLYVGAWSFGEALVAPIPNALWLGAFVAGATGAGISGVTPMLLTSLFPARVRGVSVGVVYHVGALLAAGTSTLVAWLGVPGRMGTLGTAMMAVVAAASVLTVAIIVFRPAGALPKSAYGTNANPTPGESPATPQQSR